jgi:hypothetical protein
MLIPRAHLFGNPTRAAARISPDGTMLSWLSPVDGVLNVFVAPTDAPDDAAAVTRDRGRGVRSMVGPTPEVWCSSRMSAGMRIFTCLASTR